MGASGAPAPSSEEVAALVARCKAGAILRLEIICPVPLLISLEWSICRGDTDGCQNHSETGQASGVATLRELRKALANDDEIVVQHALGAGVIEILLTALQSTCVESQLEAAWSITNIAAGSSAHTEAALATAPCLVQLLRSGSAAVQEQCAWALGNMAGDNPDFRSVDFHRCCARMLHLLVVRIHLALPHTKAHPLPLRSLPAPFPQRALPVAPRVSVTRALGLLQRSNQRKWRGIAYGGADAAGAAAAAATTIVLLW